MNEHIKMKMPVAEIGRALAYSDDFDQSAVLNSWATELRVLCGSSLDIQICAMSAHLNKDAKELIAQLNDFSNNRDQA